jgi:hypothetical protein
MIATAYPYLHDDIVKFSFLSQIAEQRFDFPDNHLKHIDFIFQDIEDVVFQCLAHREIKDKDVPVLTDPVQPADALLDPHGIPREIEIDQSIAKLQVSTLAPRFRRKEYR